MNILDANIGSAKDNMSSPVHNWYKFTAGFSYKFVDIILEDYRGQNITVYEPFAGCGTTLVECQKLGFRSVGNESQEPRGCGGSEGQNRGSCQRQAAEPSAGGYRLCGEA